MLVPSLDMWEMLPQKGYKHLSDVLREDNDACMKDIPSGRNSTMRHLHRAHGVSVRVIHASAGKGTYTSSVDVFYTPTDDMKAGTRTQRFTRAAKYAHVLKKIYVIKQEQMCDMSNRTRLNTHTSVTCVCAPVLMPIPPSYDPTHPYGKPPPPIVRNTSQLAPQRHVRIDADFIRYQPAAQMHMAVPATPTTRPQPLLASQQDDPWCAGPTRTPPLHASQMYGPWYSGTNAVTQVHIPIPTSLPADPWYKRPKPVPLKAGDQSKSIATGPVARGQSIISVPRLAIPKSTSSSSTFYSMNELRSDSTYELRIVLNSRHVTVNELWEMRQHLFNTGDIEY